MKDRKKYFELDRRRIAGKLFTGCLTAHRIPTFCLAAVLSLSMNTVAAQPEIQCYEIVIPALNAGEALNSLAAQTGITFLFPYDIAKERQANPISGCYFPMNALKQLLKGTGLSGGISERGVLKISVGKSEDIDKEMSERTKIMDTKKSILAAMIGFLFGAGSSQGALAQAPSERSVAGRSPGLEEIIVTARKREESLQDISAAVSVVDSSLLQRNVINDVRDLQTIVPNLNVAETVGIMKVHIRGLGNTTAVRSEDSEVQLHVDGAVVSRMEAQAMAFFDLQRIEVLRGPQGTLYGRNSTGGTINLITAKPTEEFEGYVNLSAGNYNLLKMETALSGPLTDIILGRIAFQSISREGFAENTFTGNDYLDDKRWAGRAHFQFNISDDVQFLLTGEYANQDDASGKASYLGDLFPGVTPPGAGGFSDPDSRDGSFSFDPIMKRETWSLTGTLDWQLNDSFKLRNIINYRELEFFLGQDLDNSSVVTDRNVGVLFDDEQVSNELQLIYESNNLNAIVGLYYFKEEFEGRQDIGTTPVSEIWLSSIGSSVTEALSPFWNASYDLNDRISLRAGGRFNHEEREISNDRVLNGVLTTHFISDDKRTFNKYTGEYGIDFNFSENAMLYYTFSQGFRSGAALVFQTDSPIVDPTLVDSHEVGLKLQSADGGVSANIAVFDATINDLQRQARIVNPVDGTLTTRVTNIDEMETKGVELDLSWAVTERLRLKAAAVYLKAEFQDYFADDQLTPVIEGIQVAGNTPRLSPEWKGNLHGEYDIPLANGALLTASANMTYIGKQYFDEFNRAPLLEDSYTLIDANLTYHPEAENWSVSVWGKNLTDEKKSSDVSFSAFGGVKTKLYINPLTWGVSINLHF